MLLQNNDRFLSMWIVFDPVIFSRMWIIFDPLDIWRSWLCCYNLLCASALYECSRLDAHAKTPFRTCLLIFIESANFLIVNVQHWTAVAKRVENQRALFRRRIQLRSSVLTCLASAVPFVERYRNLPRHHSALFVLVNAIQAWPVTEKSSSQHDWPAEAVGAA